MLPNIRDVELGLFFMIRLVIPRINSDSLRGVMANPSKDILRAINISNRKGYRNWEKIKVILMSEFGINDDAFCSAV